MSPVLTGIEVLHRDHFKPLAGQRVGLMTNPSAVDSQLDSTYRILTHAPGVQMTALFAPEHGFAGAAPDAETIATSVDPRTGLTVYSLYGSSYRPAPEMLGKVDVIVCDIQDIGVRYYTFTWTVSYILEAAGAHGVAVMILDRPNPLGGSVIDGPLLDGGMTSFVGRFPVPVRHGLTLGELAQMINARWNPTPADLTVVQCEGWRRGMAWPATGLPWVPPSPNMPHLNTLIQYPGACLIEGTELSEGRGTALPFEIVGAPWIDPFALAEHLNAQKWASSMGARFRPHTFQPTQSKWTGQYCHGVQVHITDPARWRPLAVWLGIIATLRAHYPQHFRWLAQHPDTGIQHFDRLIGSTWVRKTIEEGVNAGKPVGEIIAPLAAEWADDVHAFDLERRPYLLYD
jgi:uncharacterized protein YbbC (DUF1343 family)